MICEYLRSFLKLRPMGKILASKMERSKMKSLCFLYFCKGFQDSCMEWRDRISSKVIEFYAGEEPAIAQIQHTQTVASYTRMIAAGEGIEGRMLDLMETAAWLHDIGCPDARRCYGDSLPVHQQEMGRQKVSVWMQEVEELTGEEKQWLADVVGTHHRFDSARQFHFEPLYEADLIVNLIEGYYEQSHARPYYDTVMTTATGRKLFATLFL